VADVEGIELSCYMGATCRAAEQKHEGLGSIYLPRPWGGCGGPQPPIPNMLSFELDLISTRCTCAIMNALKGVPSDWRLFALTAT
jgi:hypothetical protein